MIGRGGCSAFRMLQFRHRRVPFGIEGHGSIAHREGVYRRIR